MRALLLLVLLVAACKHDRRDPSKQPDVVQTKVGPIKVVDSIPDDAEIMCSADYQTFPKSQIHVIPTWNKDLGNYVGSYRCNTHWKAAIAETRARFAANPTDEEGARILQVLLDRGITEQQLLPLTNGKPMKVIIPAVLDALEDGRFVLAL
jgi:hypothetical protein